MFVGTRRACAGGVHEDNALRRKSLLALTFALDARLASGQDFLDDFRLEGDFRVEDFLRVAADFDDFDVDFLAATFLPFLRASERPMAIACLRLFTVPPRPPLPLLSVPRLRRLMALFTSLDALLLVLRVALRAMPLSFLQYE
jgi:hypothetical protein